MAYKIVYLPVAEQDINDIASYLSQFYENTVGKFITSLDKSISRLSDNPYIGTAYRSYRKLVVSEYLVFYKVDDEDNVVIIFRVLHSSRDTEVRKFDRD
jgi:addiction module toxin, RelE/StbE family